MNKNELLQKWVSQLAEVELKLNMCSYLIKQGITVKEKDLNALIDRYENLKKLIEEFKKD